MEPTGGGRMRGFRAPTEDEVVRSGSPAVPEPLEAPAPASPSGPARLGSGWRWALTAAGVLAVALVVIAVLAFRLGSSSTTSSVEASATPSLAATATSPLPVTDLYARVVPSVVLVTTSKGSLGTGVVVNARGTVLTAHHVVSGGGAISVTFADGTRSAATVVAAQPKTDTAVLAPAKLPEVVVPAVLGGGVAVGSDVVAVGNPLGLRYSTSTGIVSGTDRTTRTKTGTVSGLIQFDAAVNPGSSGGPLLNDQGLVVGVVVSLADPGNDEAFAGIGFAIPIGTALGAGAGQGPGRGPQL